MRVVNQTQGGECVDASYKSSIYELQNATFDGSSSMRQWMYQVCTNL